ncbi:MAG: hypothetical protein U0599_12995 [Vicinamibacteria bacterium]
MRSPSTCALFCLAVAAFAGAGCGASATAGDVALGVEFALAPGQSVAVGEDGFPVRFVAVVEDSRCPKDVTCVRAGRVVVSVTAGTAAEPSTLEPEGSVNARGHRLRLVRVEPYPTSVMAIPPSEYRATFVVDGV